MLPARQRFHADGSTRLDIDLRLIMGNELILGDCAPQRVLGYRRRVRLAQKIRHVRADLTLEQRLQITARKRFTQMPDQAQLRCARHVRGHAQHTLIDVTEQHDAGTALLFCEITQYFNTIRIRHHHVNHDHGGVIGQHRLEFGERRRMPAGIAQRLRDSQDQCTDLQAIVNRQQALHARVPLFVAGLHTDRVTARPLRQPLCRSTAAPDCSSAYRCPPRSPCDCPW